MHWVPCIKSLKNAYLYRILRNALDHMKSILGNASDCVQLLRNALECVQNGTVRQLNMGPLKMAAMNGLTLSHSMIMALMNDESRAPKDERVGIVSYVGM